MKGDRSAAWMNWLDAVFPPFRETERVKPKNMLYMAHEVSGMGTARSNSGLRPEVPLLFKWYCI